MNGWTKVALILANIGALNWGLDTLGFNVVDVILGAGSVLSQIVYYLVAICGIFGLYKVLK